MVNEVTLNQYRQVITDAKRRLSRMKGPPHYTAMRYIMVLTVNLKAIDRAIGEYSRPGGNYDHHINPIS